jgi:bacteriochlorophyllide a dehydrogenase
LETKEMRTVAVLLEKPEHLSLQELPLIPGRADDVIVNVDFSAISSGTERLLWQGKMPSFPGMGYPLVPGYETVGRVAQSTGDFAEGDTVFVPGANCYGDVRGLFGGAAKTIATPGHRLIKINRDLGEEATLLALAATAHHAIAIGDVPDLIVGHGIVGRLIARIAVALGANPTVWETQVGRHGGSDGYTVINPATDTHKSYSRVCDASGDSSIINSILPHLAKQGVITLAGFYHDAVSFTFPPAFMREAQIRIAAEWKRADMDAVLALIAQGKISLANLITHRANASTATEAYATAFTNPDCLKMVLDWRTLQ